MSPVNLNLLHLRNLRRGALKSNSILNIQNFLDHTREKGDMGINHLFPKKEK